MKLEMVKFQGQSVGVQLEAESEEEHILLSCLAGLEAVKCQGFRHMKLGALFLCPRLPWPPAAQDPDMSGS